MFGLFVSSALRRFDFKSFPTAHPNSRPQIQTHRSDHSPGGQKNSLSSRVQSLFSTSDTHGCLHVEWLNSLVESELRSWSISVQDRNYWPFRPIAWRRNLSWAPDEQLRFTGSSGRVCD